LQIKEQIEEVKKTEDQEFPVVNMKLISLGKIMEDTKTLKDYNFKEGSFLVVMITKPKKAPKPAPEPVQPQPVEPQPAPVHPPIDPLVQPNDVDPMPPVNPQPPQANPFTDNQETQVQDLMGMGFDREQCEAALRAAFFNSDRAVEYLLNGIPAQQEEPQQPQPGPPIGGGGAMPGMPGMPPPTGGAGAGAGAGAGGAGAGGLEALANMPAFAQIRQRIVQDPNFLQQFMNGLAQN
jgi:UV excision repair protein RAD23